MLKDSLAKLTFLFQLFPSSITTTLPQAERSKKFNFTKVLKGRYLNPLKCMQRL